MKPKSRRRIRKRPIVCSPDATSYSSNRTKLKAWGIEHVPETGPFITAATHVTMFDVFVPMISMFHQGRRPRYMAKAEMASWPLIGKWFQLVGMQPCNAVRAGRKPSRKPPWKSLPPADP